LKNKSDNKKTDIINIKYNAGVQKINIKPQHRMQQQKELSHNGRIKTLKQKQNVNTGIVTWSGARLRFFTRQDNTIQYSKRITKAASTRELQALHASGTLLIMVYKKCLARYLQAGEHFKSNIQRKW
jgi:hypothetical protein